MAKVIITVEDHPTEQGQVEVSIDFEPVIEVAESATPAQVMAIQIVDSFRNES